MSSLIRDTFEFPTEIDANLFAQKFRRDFYAYDASTRVYRNDDLGVWLVDTSQRDSCD